MKQEMTELVCIIDRSGSMSGFESDTIGSFNGMIEKQKNRKNKEIKKGCEEMMHISHSFFRGFGRLSARSGSGPGPGRRFPVFPKVDMPLRA